MAAFALLMLNSLKPVLNVRFARGFVSSGTSLPRIFARASFWSVSESTTLCSSGCTCSSVSDSAIRDFRKMCSSTPGRSANWMSITCATHRQPFLSFQGRVKLPCFVGRADVLHALFERA